MIGTDPDVDRRLSAVAEVDVPFYPGLRIGVPSLPAAVETLAEGAFDAIHVCSPGPVGVGGRAASHARSVCRSSAATTPSSPPTPQLRSGERRLAQAMALAVRAFYGACDLVLSPSPRLRRGAARDRRRRPSAWRAGTAAWTLAASTPRCAAGSRLPGELNVLYAGRITREKGADLLAEAFLRRPQPRSAPAPRARRRRPRAGAPARACRRGARHLPRLARGGGARTAPTRAPTCSCSPAPPTPSAR